MVDALDFPNIGVLADQLTVIDYFIDKAYNFFDYNTYVNLV